MCGGGWYSEEMLKEEMLKEYIVEIGKMVMVRDVKRDFRRRKDPVGDLWFRRITFDTKGELYN